MVARSSRGGRGHRNFPAARRWVAWFRPSQPLSNCDAVARRTSRHSLAEAAVGAPSENGARSAPLAAASAQRRTAVGGGAGWRCQCWRPPAPVRAEGRLPGQHTRAVPASSQQTKLANVSPDGQCDAAQGWEAIGGGPERYERNLLSPRPLPCHEPGRRWGLGAPTYRKPPISLNWIAVCMYGCLTVGRSCVYLTDKRGEL